MPNNAQTAPCDTIATDPCCQRKRRSLDDIFFSTGNQLVFHNEEPGIFTKFAVEETYYYIQNDSSMNHESDVPCNADVLDDFPCPACRERFPSMQACENHYESHHVRTCHECHTVLSSEHLLDLHLQEAHDSYFEAALAKQKAHYKCVVETCPATFASTQTRHEHLQQSHGYPKWFRFLPKSQHYGDSDNQKEMSLKKRKWLKKKHKHNKPAAASDVHAIEGISKTQEDEKHRQKREHRRQARREKRAKIPCRFFATKEGCWRGDACAFLHDDEAFVETNKRTTATNGTDEAMDIDMDCVANDFQAKASLSVPDHVSFGHRHK